MKYLDNFFFNKLDLFHHINLLPTFSLILIGIINRFNWSITIITTRVTNDLRTKRVAQRSSLLETTHFSLSVSLSRWPRAVIVLDLTVSSRTLDTREAARETAMKNRGRKFTVSYAPLVLLFVIKSDPDAVHWTPDARTYNLHCHVTTMIMFRCCLTLPMFPFPTWWSFALWFCN